MFPEVKSIKAVNQFSYAKYYDLMSILAENGDTTGDRTIEHIEATKINAQRFKRIDKHLELNDELIKAATDFKSACQWIVIAESWCGDGAQCIPVIAKIAELSPNIELKIILRDENPEIMDAYLTNGSRAIPKLICFDKATNTEVGTWGPRPHKIQREAMDFKKHNPGAPHYQFVNNLHLCYARDKTRSIQDEFTELLLDWDEKCKNQRGF